MLQCIRAEFIQNVIVCHFSMLQALHFCKRPEDNYGGHCTEKVCFKQSVAEQQSLPRRRLDMEMAAQQGTESPEPLSSALGRSRAALGNPSPVPTAVASAAMMRARAALIAEEEHVRSIFAALMWLHQ